MPAAFEIGLSLRHQKLKADARQEISAVTKCRGSKSRSGVCLWETIVVGIRNASSPHSFSAFQASRQYCCSYSRSPTATLHSPRTNLNKHNGKAPVVELPGREWVLWATAANPTTPIGVLTFHSCHHHQLLPLSLWPYDAWKCQKRVSKVVLYVWLAYLLLTATHSFNADSFRVGWAGEQPLNEHRNMTTLSLVRMWTGACRRRAERTARGRLARYTANQSALSSLAHPSPFRQIGSFTNALAYHTRIHT